MITLSSNSYSIVSLPTGKQKIEMEDFSSFTVPNASALPSIIFNILIPPLSQVKSIKIINSEIEDLGYGFKIVRAPELLSDNGLKEEEEENYELPDVIENLEVKRQRKWTFLEVLFSPFDYNEKNGHLVLTKSITLNIEFQRNLNVSKELLNDNVLDNLILSESSEFVNKSSYKDLGYSEMSQSQTETYLIITTNNIKSSGILNDFITFKQSQGFNVNVVAVESISETGIDLAEKIRNYLINHYIVDSIEYVLLIGDINNIPMRYCYPNKNMHEGVQDFDPDFHKIPTDFYYADLTGNWNSDSDNYFGEYGDDDVDLNADIYVGRIPFSDTSIISNILQRSKNFEQDNGSWKKKALLLGAISNYQNEDNTGYSKTDGAVVMERMWGDFLQSNGFSRITMYEKSGLDPSTYLCNYHLTHDNVVNHWKK